MMEEKLYISDNALEKFSFKYFSNVSYDDYKGVADGSFKELEDGLLVSRSDMYDIYLQANEDDESFNDIDDIQDIIYIDSHYEVFNMRVICERASVGYSTFRNWKSNAYRGLSDYKISRLVEEMKKACE